VGTDITDGTLAISQVAWRFSTPKAALSRLHVRAVLQLMNVNSRRGGLVVVHLRVALVGSHRRGPSPSSKLMTHWSDQVRALQSILLGRRSGWSWGHLFVHQANLLIHLLLYQRYLVLLLQAL